MKQKQLLSRPTLILVMGVAGSGKTNVARSILERVNAVYLDNNFIADAFFPHTRSDAEYLKIRRNLYDALYRITEENLNLGNSVLLDVPHVAQVQDRKWQDFLKDLLARCAARLAVIRCFCSEEELRRRLKQRGAPRDQWKLDHWEEFLTRQPLQVEIPFEHIELNTEAEPGYNLNRALAYLSREG